MSAGKSSWELDEDGNQLPISDGVAALANGTNIVTVYVQLSTGEKQVAYTGTLIP